MWRSLRHMYTAHAGSGLWDAFCVPPWLMQGPDPSIPLQGASVPLQGSSIARTNTFGLLLSASSLEEAPSKPWFPNLSVLFFFSFLFFFFFFFLENILRHEFATWTPELTNPLHTVILILVIVTNQSVVVELHMLFLSVKMKWCFFFPFPTSAFDRSKEFCWRVALNLWDDICVPPKCCSFLIQIFFFFEYANWSMSCNYCIVFRDVNLNQPVLSVSYFLKT